MTDLITIDNELPPVLVVVGDETAATIGLLTVKAQACEITDRDSYDAANALYSEIKEMAKAIETRRKELKAPLLTMGKALDAAANPVHEHLLLIAEKVSKHVLEWKASEEARILGDLPPGDTAEHAPKLKCAVRKKSQQWDLCIEDQALIPRSLLVPNEKAIKAVLEAGGEVPGCRLIPRAETRGAA